MTPFEAWFARKLERRRLSIREAREVAYVHKRALGGRGEYASITMQIEPADDFGFDSVANWPETESAEKYVQSVLDGVLDELLAQDVGFAVTRLRVLVLAVEWHPIDSSQRAFYFAARGAVRRALGLDDWYAYNVDLPTGAS